jgi:hypothetical protein
MASDPALEYALAHMWQGKRLGEHDTNELFAIWYMLVSVSPPGLAPKITTERDTVIIAIWRLDKALDKHRPLGNTPVTIRVNGGPTAIASKILRGR